MISVEHVFQTVSDPPRFGGQSCTISTSKMEKGEKIGILGRNGAGKSTLIRLISGVEPPTTGENQADDEYFLAFGILRCVSRQSDRYGHFAFPLPDLQCRYRLW